MQIQVQKTPLLFKNILCISITSILSQMAFAAESNASIESTTTINQLPTIAVQAKQTDDKGYIKTKSSTATKLNIDVKKTPQSVTTISRKQIEDMGFNNLGEALTNTTGIVLTGDNSERTNFSIRGFNLGDGWNSNLLQFDGIALNASNVAASKPDMAMIESIEVLRGASGLMQGSGEPSGAINLIRKKPTEHFQANGSVSYGSWNTVRGEVDLSGPLNQQGSVRGRFVAAYQDGDSWMKAVTRDTNLLYGIISADLTPSTLLNLGFSQQKEHAVPVGGLPRFSDGSDLALDRENCGCDYRDFWDKKNSQAFIDLTHEFNENWMMKAAYINANIDMDMRFTSLALAANTTQDHPQATVNKYAYRYQQDINAFDLFTKGKLSLFGREHEVVVGANYQHSKLPGQWTSFDNMLADGSLWNSAQGKPNNPYLVDLWTYKPFQLPSGESRYSLDGGISDVESKQSGLYITSRWNILDPLNVIAGIRQSNYEYSSKYTSNVDGLRKTARDTQYKKSNVLTPYFGLTYDINDVVTAYASYTDSFVVQNVKDRNGNLLDPIQGNVYELGIKAGFNDDQVIASLATFRTNQINRSIDDLSTLNQCPENGANSYCKTASGKVISEGIETELRGEILPNLNLIAGYTYNTTEYKKDPKNQGRVFNETTPEHIARLFASYKLPNQLTIGGGVNYQSEWKVGRYGVKPATQEGYALVNLMASYPLSDQVTIALNMNNIFDEKYYSYISETTNRYGEPRNAKLTLRAKF